MYTSCRVSWFSLPGYWADISLFSACYCNPISTNQHNTFNICTWSLFISGVEQDIFHLSKRTVHNMVSSQFGNVLHCYRGQAHWLFHPSYACVSSMPTQLSLFTTKIIYFECTNNERVTVICHCSKIRSWWTFIFSGSFMYSKISGNTRPKKLHLRIEHIK